MTEKKNIEDIRKFISSFNNILLSENYNNNRGVLKVLCKIHGIWEATWHSINSGKRCPKCSSKVPKKYDNIFKENYLKLAKKYASENNGKCVSNRYINNRKPLKWVCSNNHIWESNFKNVVISKSWCPICISDNFIKYDDLKLIAIKRGGKLISDSILQKLEWECSVGHRWFASIGNIVGRNSWCPYCSSGLCEEICRKYFEILFEYSFPKFRSGWLVNRYGNIMELDGFCYELKLAFEHNGLQHYEENSFFCKNNFKRLTENDIDKIKICSGNNINIIIIPELFRIMHISELKKYILEQSDLKNIYVPNRNKIINHKEVINSIRRNK